MAVRDSTRFGRTEILNRFRAEIAARYLDLEPYYSHKTGLLSFKTSLGDVGCAVERMLSDIHGVPNTFILADESGLELSRSDIYGTINAIVERCGGVDALRIPFPDFEFVAEEQFLPGDWGRFNYDGKDFYVLFNDMRSGPEDMGYTAYVIDRNGLSVANFSELEGIKNQYLRNRRHHGADSPAYPKKTDLTASEEPSKVKARRFKEVVASDKTEDTDEPIEVTAAIFGKKGMQRHIREHAFQYRPYKRVIKIERMTSAEVREHKQWLRKTKRHRKLYAARYYKKFHNRIERNNARREKMNIRLKPHKPNFQYTYRR